MRMTVWGVGVGAVLLVALVAVLGPRSEALAQRPGVLPGGPADGLQAFTVPVNDKKQMLIVVDPKQHVVSTYHVDTQSGEIALKGVRNIHWDLQMSEFNGVNPLPREIRALLEPRN